MAKQFDYAAAREEGYSDDEILNYLAEKHSHFDVPAALEEGYTPSEINEYLSTYKPKRSALEKTGRVAAQAGLGATEAAIMPYEIGVSPLSSKQAMQVPFREQMMSDIEQLLEQKQSGIWSDQDQALYNQLVSQMQRPEESEPFIKTADVSVRGLAEKVTGADLHPEGFLEKATHWYSFIKKPTSFKELKNIGSSAKEITKALIPGKDALRGLGAGAALQIAEEGDFGPIGTMAAAITGDLVGGSLKGAAQAIAKPKQTFAKAAAKLATSKSSVIKDLQAAGKELGPANEFTKDIGTLTGNNLVKMIQAKLAASGLTGKALDELRQTMTKEVVEGYNSIAKEVGQIGFETRHEAGEVAKEYIRNAMEKDKALHEQLYKKFNESLPAEAKIVPANAIKTIMRMESELAPGAVKSADQQFVLNKLRDLTEEFVRHEAGNEVSVKGLLNTKRALQDMVDYEVSGGYKNQLKEVIKELDKDIKSIGRQYPQAINLLDAANKKFQEHIGTYRNKNLVNLMRSQDPRTLINKMGSTQGIRELRKALGKNPKDKEIFGNLARMKLDELIGNNLKDGATNHLKMGTFSNLLKNTHTRELIKELLPKEAYKRLERLQKHVGDLYESANKFFNASQTATSLTDYGTVALVLKGMGSILFGNPWPLVKIGGALIGARQLTKLLGDTEFLKLVEEAIKVSKKNSLPALERFTQDAVPYLQRVVPAAAESTS